MGKWIVVLAGLAASLVVAAVLPTVQVQAVEAIWVLGPKQELKGEESFCDPRTERVAGSVCMDIVDWDGDGLLDLVVKNFINPDKPDYATMQYVCFRNVGTKRAPRFGEGAVLLAGTAKGEYMCVNDWDEDGKVDLILPGVKNRVALNRGTPDKPQFEFKAMKAKGSTRRNTARDSVRLYSTGTGTARRTLSGERATAPAGDSSISTATWGTARGRF